jgi:beta-glucosidase/6-phospho-beta-glucosidase/beta-galactosidase
MTNPDRAVILAHAATVYLMSLWNRRTFLRNSAHTAALTALPLPIGKAALAQKAAPANTFPAGFLWGASTSAVQIEGSLDADGSGRSILEPFESTPGAIKDGSTNFIAADEYHRYAEDIGHMSEIGLNAYRFSFGWPRILPQGTGQPNGKALAYYDRLVDPRRTAFLNSYLAAYKRAHREGVPVAGYFHWSLLDNWEFASGYKEQFGLVYVDRNTQKRILKDSAFHYKEIIQSNGANL